MSELTSIQSKSDIPKELQNTPVGLLLEYNNLDRVDPPFQSAQLLIGMCMDNRKHLHTPDNFAFILRAGGANFKRNQFKISYAIAVGGVRHMALIGHSQCGMVNLKSRKEIFIQGLVSGAGWTREKAEEHFDKYEPIFEIKNETDFILSEVKRLREDYPKIQITPLFYKVEDNLLYVIKE